MNISPLWANAGSSFLSYLKHQRFLLLHYNLIIKKHVTVIQSTGDKFIDQSFRVLVFLLTIVQILKVVLYQF